MLLETPQNTAVWEMAIYTLAVVAMIAAVLAMSAGLGERRKDHEKRQVAYESGILPTGSARLRLTAKFYLIAMFFVVFDLEAVFIFAWVIAFDELGWGGYVEIVIFIGVLVAGLVYLWRQGALDWGTSRKKKTMTNVEARMTNQ